MCSDDLLQEVGYGTEQVCEVLGDLLPGARIERMDRDTTRGHALPRLLASFRAREIDVLVGTQMVAKGHDFPGVTLVGVLMAELGLRVPDFRAAERTFQLMTQIAGRAGRAESPGRVLIQTYVPDHYALKYAREHDATGFLQEELGRRRDRMFPPWSFLGLWRIEGPDRVVTQHEAERLAHALRSVSHAIAEPHARPHIVGPQGAPIERVKGRWRYQILVKSPGRAVLGALLSRVSRMVDEAKLPSNLRISLDVDPINFL